MLNDSGLSTVINGNESWRVKDEVYAFNAFVADVCCACA